MFWSFGLLMAGITGVAFLMLFQSITINNESEYYVLKEAMEAAMLESVDVACYRSDAQEGCGGVVKISEQKFVENFTRRFAASIGGDATQYEIEFYDIIESPPKASVVIKGRTQDYKILSSDGASFDIVNSLDGILVYDSVHSKEEVSSDTAVLDVEVPNVVTESKNKVPEDYDQRSAQSACNPETNEPCIIEDTNDYIVQDEVEELTDDVNSYFSEEVS